MLYVNVSVHLISSTLVLIDLFNFVVSLIKVGVKLLHPCTIVYDLNEQGIKSADPSACERGSVSIAIDFDIDMDLSTSISKSPMS